MKRAFWTSTILLLGTYACVGTGDARCGPDQMFVEPGVCVCVPDYLIGKSGQCIPIAPAPVVDAGQNLDAGADAGADAGTEPEVDAGPPSSLGRTCSSSNQCGPDAPFCEDIYYKMCLIVGCRVTPDDCPPTWECCDLREFGAEDTVCVRSGGCPL